MRILVDPHQLRQAAQEMQRITADIQAAVQRADAALKSVRWEGREKAQIDAHATTIRNRSAAIGQQSVVLTRFLGRAADRFEAADRAGVQGVQGIAPLVARMQRSWMSGAGAILRMPRMVDRYRNLGLVAAATSKRKGVMRRTPYMEEGYRGPAVRRLQLILNTLGFSPGKIDGEFGPATRRAVERFQAANRIQKDGVVGNQTWAAINRRLIAHQQSLAATGPSRPHRPSLNGPTGHHTDMRPIPLPPPGMPRVYVINGITGDNIGSGHHRDEGYLGMMEKLLIRAGLPSSEFVNTSSVYDDRHHRDVPWQLGVSPGFTGLDDIYDSVDEKTEDIADVIREANPLGNGGKFSDRILNDVLADLRRNPLEPGQEIVLIGHSGGGAIAANVAGLLKNELGRNLVKGVVTMGSPAVNWTNVPADTQTLAIIDSGDRFGDAAQNLSVTDFIPGASNLPDRFTPDIPIPGWTGSPDSHIQVDSGNLLPWKAHSSYYQGTSGQQVANIIAGRFF